MSVNERRSFLKKTTATVATGALLSVSKSATASKPDQKIVIGAIGVGGRGGSVARLFAKLPNVEIAYACDVDIKKMEQSAKEIEKITGKLPAMVTDFRKILEDKSVDAVLIGMPDHWHGPATLLALEAGKHVYVEKPASHNLREGRLMVNAARKYKRVVQVGTQARSSGAVREAIQLIKDGAIGDILVSKAWNSQLRGSMGHKSPTDPPEGFDYDLWTGPAEKIPFKTSYHPAHWRWFHNFGTGDLGNDGVHEFDIARWGLGVDEHPTFVSGFGGKYFHDDDQEFPDTAYCTFVYPGKGGGRDRQLIFEQRDWSPYVQEGHENGNAFYGTKGMLILGKSKGWQLFGRRNKLIKSSKGSGMDGTPHCQNFLKCIREGGTPHADIWEGHLSTSLAHLGNIAIKLGGQAMEFQPETEKFVNNKEADQLITRKYREGHWAIPKNV